MKKSIDIDNRLYEDVVQWCNANGVESVTYIEKAIREHLATDKYGDLNEKIRKKDKTPLSVKLPETPIQTPKSVTGEETKEAESVSTQENNVNDMKNEIVEDTTVKTKRTIKSK